MRENQQISKPLIRVYNKLVSCPACILILFYGNFLFIPKFNRINVLGCGFSEIRNCPVKCKWGKRELLIVYYNFQTSLTGVNYKQSWKSLWFFSLRFVPQKVFSEVSRRIKTSTVGGARRVKPKGHFQVHNRNIYYYGSTDFDRREHEPL